MYKLINKTTDSSVLQLPGKANRRGAERGGRGDAISRARRRGVGHRQGTFP